MGRGLALLVSPRFSWDGGMVGHGFFASPLNVFFLLFCFLSVMKSQILRIQQP